MKRTAIRYSFLIMLILPLFAHGQASMKMSAGQVDAARWIETRFARGKVPPFSFVYGDKSSKSLLPGWNYSMKRLPGDDPDVVKYLYTYTERPSGLKVECFVTGFPAFDAVEWVLHFTNTGKSDSRGARASESGRSRYAGAGRRATSRCTMPTEITFRKRISIPGRPC